MTPEQTQYFLEAMKSLLLAGSEGIEVEGKLIRLRDSEFNTGARLIWLGKESNGYINMTHEEAMSLCGTSAKATLRYHLMRLRDALVLRSYSTNGTVRAKIAAYPGSELIVHERNSRTSSTNSLMGSTNSRMGSTPDDENSESREWGSRDRAAGQLLRDAGSRDRAAGQHFNRNFDNSESTKLVSQLDLTNPPTNGTNKLTVPDPVEEALSVTFLLAAGFWPKTAKQLAKTHPFETLRRAVAFWWCNRRSRGGEFDERPGIVIAWLSNPDETTIPEKLSPEFLASGLYLNHRRKSEMVTTPEIEIDQVEESEEPERPTQWPEMNEYWAVALERMREALPAGTFNAWLEGSRAELDDNVNSCTVIVDSATKRDYLQANLRQMISREINKSTGYKLTLSFELRRRS